MRDDRDDVPGNPTELPGYDVPGEEWYAAEAEEPVEFGPASTPRPPSRPVRAFSYTMLTVIAVAVAVLIVVMITAVRG